MKKVLPSRNKSTKVDKLVVDGVDITINSKKAGRKTAEPCFENNSPSRKAKMLTRNAQ